MTYLGHALVCCCDPRLHNFVAGIDPFGGYRSRDFGLPFSWPINQGALLTWQSVLSGFPKNSQPISDVLVLPHTDCLAIHTNEFFAALREKRDNYYANTHEGELSFCQKQIEKIALQIERFPSIGVEYHFGVIETEKSMKLPSGASLEAALECVIWRNGKVPAFLEQHKDHQTRTGTVLHSVG